MQYRMRGATYDLGDHITDTYELDRVQWLARRASYNPELQKAAQSLLQRGAHIRTSDRGEYVVVDDHYTVEQVEQSWMPPLPAKEAIAENHQTQEEASVTSPTIAVNVQSKRYYLVINVESSTAFRLVRSRHNPLPTTEECMIWNLMQCNARKQPDGSWSLPPRVTREILEECLHFDVVETRPTLPSVDPLISSYQQYNSHISGY